MPERSSLPIGYKQTKIGIIPKEWAVKSLAECFSISAGRDLIKETFSATKTKICNSPIFSNSMENKGLYGYTSNPRYPAGSLTVTGRGTLGVAEFRTESFDAIIRLLVLTPKMELCGNLIAEYINYRKPFFFECTGIPQLTAPQISQTLIPIPPIEEQKKISELLSEWDNAIELQTNLIEKLELRKRAMMQRLLTGRIRLNGFSGKWQAKLLCELGTFEKGYGVPKEQIREKGHKAITYGEIYTQYDYVIKKFVSFIDDATAEISKPISCGAILFAGSGETLEDIGKCIAYVDNDIAYAGGDIIIFNPNPDINSLVLSYYLNSPSAIIQKRRYGQGHSVVHIYTKDLAKITVLLPSLAEQTAIAEVLISADKEIEIAKNKLSSLRNQKRGLIQQLLTGKKRVI